MSAVNDAARNIELFHEAVGKSVTVMEIGFNHGVRAVIAGADGSGP